MEEGTYTLKCNVCRKKVVDYFLGADYSWLSMMVEKHRKKCHGKPEAYVVEDILDKLTGMLERYRK